MSAGARPLDLVVYGATGYSGRQAAAHLAGRDRARLEALAATLPQPRPICARQA